MSVRRLVATSVMVVLSSLTAGCGLLDDDAEPLPELGPLETFTAKDLRIKLPCTPARTSQTATVPGRAKPLSVLSWSCEGPDSAYTVSTMRLPADVQGTSREQPRELPTRSTARW